MAVTDWKTPSTIVSDGDGSYTWSNPGNAASDDNNYASVVISGSGSSDHLKATNFGFSTSDVPSGSNIDGVEVRYRRYASAATRVTESSVRLAIGSTIGGDSKSNSTFWATSEEESDTKGGSADLWGNSISDSDVRSTGFGVGIAATKVLAASRTAYIDVIEMRVYYSTATNATISGVTASANASGLVPTLSTTKNATVSGVSGSATASALGPTIDAQVWTTTLPPPATANASAPLPTISTAGEAIISGQCASATASALTPVISVGSLISGECASATASALIPSVSTTSDATITGECSSASASAPTPVIITATIISGECATANASAPAPIIVAPHDTTIGATCSSSYAIAPAPSPQQLLYSVTGHLTNYISGDWSDTANLVDGNIATFGYDNETTPPAPPASFYVDTPSFSSPTGDIERVYVRAYGYVDTDDARAALKFFLSSNGITQENVVAISSTPGWTEWVDVTEAKGSAYPDWTWSDVETIDFYIKPDNTDRNYTLSWPTFISAVEVQVQYVPSQHALVQFYEHIRSGGASGWQKSPVEAIADAPAPAVTGQTTQETYSYSYPIGPNIASDLYLVQYGDYGAQFASNNCPGTHLGDIQSVRIRFFNYWDGHGNDGLWYVRPVAFTGGEIVYYMIDSRTTPGWSDWIDITNSAHNPGEWTWDKIADQEVVVVNAVFPFAVPGWSHNYLSACEIQVEYLSYGATISGECASANASAPFPTISGDANVVAVTPSATASAFAPTLGADVTISVTATPSATASALEPALNTGTSSSISGECATSSASASVPSVSTQAIISGAICTASASAPAPDISAGISIAAEYGYAQAIAPKPGISVNIAVAGECASSSASTLLPVLSTGARISGVTATASASAPTPEFLLGASVSGECATANASFLYPRIGSILETVDVLSPIAGSMSGALRAATIAGSMGAATRAPVIAGISALLVRRAAIAGSMAGATRQAAIAGSSSVADRDAVIAGSAAATQRASPIAGHTGR